MDNIKSMYIMMVSVAFIDGALRITNIPTFYLWKDFLHVTPGVNCLLRYVTKLPWCIKPVFAYFSDRHYIWGYRTKIYFIITGIIETISFLLLGIQVKSVLYTTVLVFIHQATIAFRDCLAEGLMVVISKKEDEQKMLNNANKDQPQTSSSQKYVSVIFILRFVGALSSSYIAGLLLQKFTAHQVLAISAIFPVIATIQATFFFKEERNFNQEEIISKFQGFSLKEILQFIEDNQLKNYLYYTMVMLLWPNTINGVRYYLIDQIGLTTRDIGLIFTLSSLFYVVYMFFMNTFFADYSLRKYYDSICYMMIFDIVIRQMQLEPSLKSMAFLFAVLDQSINNLFYDLPSIPLLAIVCRKCPQSKEATYYGFFVSVSNFFCSMANFTGFFFLNTMDVSETEFSNVSSVNFLCLVWSFACFHLVRLVQFPEESRTIKQSKPTYKKSFTQRKLSQLEMQSRKSKKSIASRIQENISEEIDYSEPQSEGFDEAD